MNEDESPAKHRAGPPPFDPHKYTVKTRGGREYLQVADRVRWMNADREAGGYEIEIHSQVVYVDADRAVVMSTVTIPGRGTATGVKSEVRPGLGGQKGFGAYVEKAHTQSIGRALALLGYGTDMALELWDEDMREGGEAAEAADTPREPAVAGSSKPAVVATKAGGLTTEKGLVEKAGAALKQAAGAAAGDPLAQRRTHANEEIKRLAREHGYTPPQSYGALLKLATDQYGYTKLPPKVASPQQIAPQILEDLVVHMKQVAGDPAADEGDADKAKGEVQGTISPFEQAPEAAAEPEREARYQGAIADFRRALEAYTVAAQLDDVIKLVRDLRKEGCLRQSDAEALEALHASRVREVEKTRARGA